MDAHKICLLRYGRTTRKIIGNRNGIWQADRGWLSSGGGDGGVAIVSATNDDEDTRNWEAAYTLWPSELSDLCVCLFVCLCGRESVSVTHLWPLLLLLFSPCLPLVHFK